MASSYQTSINHADDPASSSSGQQWSKNAEHTLLSLPAELIQSILSYLEVLDLAKVAQTCRRLSSQSYDDRIWQPLVNASLLKPLSSPHPCKSFRDLYLAHYPHWYLVQNRIWFGDSEPSGKLIVARYEPDQGRIAAYTMLATRGSHILSFWEKDQEVIIHSFDPIVRLDLNQPVVKLDVDSARRGSMTGSEMNYGKEIVMDTFEDEGLFSSFMHTRALPHDAISEGTQVWPPQRFPSASRTRNDTQDSFTSTGHRPTCLADISRETFRTRRWVEYTGRRAHPVTTSPGAVPRASNPGIPAFVPRLLRYASGGVSNPRMPEFLTTFATLPPSCYTPSASKPWQGIWCGDYSGHGCEFLLITQPDTTTQRPLPDGMEWLRNWFAGSDHFAQRRDSTGSDRSWTSVGSSAVQALDTITDLDDHANDDVDDDALLLPAPQTDIPFPVPESNAKDYSDVPTGRLEAIKLTGDPNIPRGEYTFIAPEIGHGGFVRVADEAIFAGARVVRSAGHIAVRGFVRDQYTPSQLIMISTDRLAQYWEGFGHISYYQRIDLDALLHG